MVDFLGVVSWCIDNCKNDVSRRAQFRMSLEPYLADAERALGDNPTKVELLAYAESVVAGAAVKWQWLYEHLADWDSKAILLDILAYRTIGWRYVRLPLDSAEFWECMETLSRLEKEGTPVSFDQGPSLAKVNLSTLGYDATVLTDAFGIFNEFLYTQYQYRGRRALLAPGKGDVVLDCGACFGGTSLYFADRVGPEGKVVSFEFFPGNIEVYKRNMSENPRLSSRVTLRQAPVWIKEGVPMSIEYAGPAAQVYEAPETKDTLQVMSTTIDATSVALPRVDLIKMDIEGAELQALRGARRTLEKFKPTLAICVYHKLFDFYEIPEWLDGLGLGYRFFLQHSSVHGDETVLFADARGQ